MTTEAPPITDSLASLADSQTQRLAARLAQEVFTGTFRQATAPHAAEVGKLMSEAETQCYNWCLAGEDDNTRALRLALLISGLDQWGLAYSQAFTISAIPALSALIGALRTRLNPQADALFQWFYNQIDQVETDAIDFKVELRRNIHLALWHAMAACESDSESKPIIQSLGSLLLTLYERMPNVGWRLIADALANIQVSLLNDAAASPVAQTGTQQLFESLQNALPQDRYRQILAYSTQAVLAWQQSRRSSEGQ